MRVYFVYISLILIWSELSIWVSGASGIVKCVIDSTKKWNDCPVSSSASSGVEVGQRVQIKANPVDQIWTDWYIPATADGYKNKYHVPTRYPSANLFELICCFREKGNNKDKDAHCEAVGSAGGLTVSVADRVLSCYANDNSMFYWNNIGSLSVDISVDSSTSLLSEGKEDKVLEGSSHGNLRGVFSNGRAWFDEDLDDDVYGDKDCEDEDGSEKDGYDNEVNDDESKDYIFIDPDYQNGYYAD
jgi:hypothetical protein